MVKPPLNESFDCGSILGSASRDFGGALRLFAYALLGALALCETAWCVEQGSAIEELQRAVSDLRRSGGLYDPRQVVLLNQLVDLHSLQGDIDEAIADLAYLESVSERTAGRLSTQHAATLAEIADWHCRLGEFESGRQRFRRSIERLRNRDDEALIGALLGLVRSCFHELAAEGIATSPESLDSYRGPVLRRNRMSIGSPAFRYRVHKILRPEGDEALRYAARLAESATLTPQRRAAVLLQVGDWFQAKDHVRTARRYYASAQRWLQRTVVVDDPLDTEGVRFRQAFR
jgi:tetratricopeptide (TPR) repeat protein